MSTAHVVVWPQSCTKLHNLVLQKSRAFPFRGNFRNEIIDGTGRKNERDFYTNTHIVTHRVSSVNKRIFCNKTVKSVKFASRGFNSVRRLLMTVSRLGVTTIRRYVGNLLSSSSFFLWILTFSVSKYRTGCGNSFPFPVAALLLTVQTKRVSWKIQTIALTWLS